MLVQVCGLPGAGKSTLSAAIAEQLPLGETTQEALRFLGCVQ